MSQTSSFTIANLAGAGYRAAVNAALQALASSNGGTTEPTETHPFMFWADTTSGLMKIRNAANTGWINSFPLTLVISEFAATLLDDADAAAMRATLGAAEDAGLIHTTGDESKAGILTFSSSPVVPTPSAGDSSTKVANTAFVSVAVAAAPYPPKHIDGLVGNNNATDANNDFDISAGHCRDASNAYNIEILSPITKRLDAAWAVGTNQGGLFTGSKASNTTYHCIIIRRDSDGLIDWGYDTSIAGSNKPSGWSFARHADSVITDGSGNIIGRKAMEVAGGGIRIDWNSVQSNFTTTVLGLTPLSAAMQCPLGLEVEAHLGFGCAQASTAVSVDIYYPGKTAQTADISQGRSLSTNTAATGSSSAGKITVRTNTSAQVMVVCDDAGTSIFLATYGYSWGRR